MRDDDSVVSWRVALLRYLAGLAVIVAAGWANLALVPRLLASVGVDPDRLEFGGVLVGLGAVFVLFVGVATWTFMWRLRRVADRFGQLGLLIISVAIVFALGYLVTGALGSNV
jgi:hypothetical protein